MIFWALIIVVTVKYVILIMRADNDGEGGTLALAALAHRSPGIGRGMKTTIGIGADLGLALFFGDGMLTPAITVLSRGRRPGSGSQAFEPLVVPLTLVILIGLFALQSRGTAKIGRLFGPVMLLWFVVLACLGAASRRADAATSWPRSIPLCRRAVRPCALDRLRVAGRGGAGGDRLRSAVRRHGPFRQKADPICLVLCRAARAAAGLFRPGRGVCCAIPRRPASPSFPSCRTGRIMPMVMLATLAAVIASQAVITGVFSMTQQAVQLGQLPRMEIRHTSATEYGQIYVPRMNACCASAWC